VGSGFGSGAFYVFMVTTSLPFAMIRNQHVSLKLIFQSVVEKPIGKLSLQVKQTGTF
jgi:hypothetical protein